MASISHGVVAGNCPPDWPGSCRGTRDVIRRLHVGGAVPPLGRSRDGCPAAGRGSGSASHGLRAPGDGAAIDAAPGPDGATHGRGTPRDRNMSRRPAHRLRNRITRFVSDIPARLRTPQPNPVELCQPEPVAPAGNTGIPGMQDVATEGAGSSITARTLPRGCRQARKICLCRLPRDLLSRKIPDKVAPANRPNATLVSSTVPRLGND